MILNKMSFLLTVPLFLFAINAAANEISDVHKAQIYMNDGYCGFPDGNSGTVITDEGWKIQPNSSNRTNILKLRCSADVAPPVSGHAEVYTANRLPVACGLYLNGEVYNTTIWQAVVPKSGKGAHLDCTFNGKFADLFEQLE